MNPFKNIISGIIDFVLPPVCIYCNESVEAGIYICEECRHKMEINRDVTLESEYIDEYFSLYRFINDGVVQQAVHDLKYSKFTNIGLILGKETGEMINKKFSDNYDLIIPVPLHRSRKRERTYNQSDYICKGIGDVTGIKVNTNIIKRTRWTESQTKLDKDKRVHNVKDAFSLNHQADVKGLNIILVDDVITTGSTIKECAKILKLSGCGKILACSAARAA